MIFARDVGETNCLFFVHIVRVAWVEHALSMMYFYVETYNKVFVPQALTTELHPQKEEPYLFSRIFGSKVVLILKHFQQK